MSQNNGSHNRKYPRSSVNLNLRATYQGREFDLKLINAGIGGGFAQSERCFPAGTVLELNRNHSAPFKGKVVHQQKNGFGIQFINPPQSFLKMIPQNPSWRRFLDEHPDYEKSTPWAVLLTLPYYYFAKAYFNLEIKGVENIPYGSRFVWTQNHSGWNAVDGPLVAYIIARNNHVDRFDWSSKTMGWGHTIRKLLSEEVGDWGVNFWNSFAYHLPILSKLYPIVHGLPIDHIRNPETLREYNIYGTPAEGEEGNCKSSFTQLYQLQRFRSGVARLALETKVGFIQPTAVIGPEESFLNLGTIRATKHIFGTVFPLPLFNIPLPVKWVVSFLPPFDVRPYQKKFDRAGKKRKMEICRQIMDEIQTQIKEEILKETEKRTPYLPWFFEKGKAYFQRLKNITRPHDLLMSPESKNP